MHLLKSKKKGVAHWWAQVLVIDGDFRKSTENVRVQLQVGRPYHWQKTLHNTGPCKTRKGKHHNWNVALRVPVLDLNQDFLKFQVFAKPYVLIDESLIGEGTIQIKQFQLHNASMARVVCTYQNKDRVTLNVKVTVDDGSGTVATDEVVETKTTVTHNSTSSHEAVVPIPGAVVYAAPPPLPPQQVVHTTPVQTVVQYPPPLPGPSQPQYVQQTTQVQYAPPVPGQQQPQPQYAQPQYAPQLQYSPMPTPPGTPLGTNPPPQFVQYPPQGQQPQYAPQGYPLQGQSTSQYPPQQYAQNPPQQHQSAPQQGYPPQGQQPQYAQPQPGYPQQGHPQQGQPQYPQ